MYRSILSAAAVLLFATSPAAAQSFSTDRLSGEIRTISGDDFQGRFPGSEGERKTLAWLQAQYEAMGLEPGGPDGEWLQPVELKRYVPVAGAAFAAWTDSAGGLHPIAPGEDLVVRAVTNDGKAAITDAPMVFAGYGITAPERRWDDYGDLDVRGAVVVVAHGQPDTEAFTGANALSAYNDDAYKCDEAFRRGAIGVLFISAQDSGSRDWQAAVQGAAYPRRLPPGSADLEFIGEVTLEFIKRLDPAAMASGLRQLDTGAFRATRLEGVRLSVHAEETVTTTVTYNLLAKIPGTDHPDETVFYSAHWDHLGGEAQHPEAEGADKIWNGAWDNASGTIGVLEMARQLSEAPRPKRTLIFAHMAAEEMGMMGSYGYTADPVYPLATMVADINIDMLPLSGPTRDVPIFGKGQNDLEDRLDALARPLGRYVSDDHQPEQGFYYRSDHFPFARAGVPAIMTWHGWDFVDGGMSAGEAAWRARFAAVYHQPSDEWSADWDLTSAVESLTLLYHLGLGLANSDDWPQWKPTSEFAQVRARSAAARR